MCTRAHTQLWHGGCACVSPKGLLVDTHEACEWHPTNGEGSILCSNHPGRDPSPGLMLPTVQHQTLQPPLFHPSSRSFTRPPSTGVPSLLVTHFLNGDSPPLPANKSSPAAFSSSRLMLSIIFTLDVSQTNSRSPPQPAL